MTLIDVNRLKQYIDDCKCCEKCDKIGFMCNDDCELPDFLTKQWERVLDEQPIIEAIPIDFIEKKIEEYREKEEKTKDVPLYGSFQWLRVNERLTLESLLLEWYAETEEQNET